ncbi:hypothetical protein Gogos_017748, partial [Gossypium gossypioides]|nr:hypothetical protein [Gossypium gossypioides]
VSSNPYNYKDLQKHLYQINRIIPADIWPPGDTLAPWDIRIKPPTPYQEYGAIENTPAWTNSQEKTSPMELEDNLDNSRDGFEQKIEQMEIKSTELKKKKQR